MLGGYCNGEGIRRKKLWLANKNARAGQSGVGFQAFGGEEIEELGGAGIFLGFAVAIDAFEVSGSSLDGFGFPL